MNLEEFKFSLRLTSALGYASGILMREAIKPENTFLRHNMGDCFAPVSYISTGDFIIKSYAKIFNSDKLDKHSEKISTAGVLAGLTALEIEQSTLPGRSFDTTDMLCYGLGTATYFAGAEVFKQGKDFIPNTKMFLKEFSSATQKAVNQLLGMDRSLL